MTLTKKLYWDITPLVTKEFPLWPGSHILERTCTSDMSTGDALTTSNMCATVHLGAHADAPSHYNMNGESIENCSLDYYLGLCQVIRLNLKKGELIREEHIKNPLLASRILFATSTFEFNKPFQEDFSAFDPHFFELMGKKNIKTVGIDTPSVDPYHSETFPCHRLAFRFKIALLENLDLKNIPEGVYELIALPLKIQGFDASPVRAILREIKD